MKFPLVIDRKMYDQITRTWFERGREEKMMTFSRVLELLYIQSSNHIEHPVIFFVVENPEQRTRLCKNSGCYSLHKQDKAFFDNLKKKPYILTRANKSELNFWHPQGYHAEISFFLTQLCALNFFFTIQPVKLMSLKYFSYASKLANNMVLQLVLKSSIRG